MSWGTNEFGHDNSPRMETFLLQSYEACRLDLHGLSSSWKKEAIFWALNCLQQMTSWWDNNVYIVFIMIIQGVILHSIFVLTSLLNQLGDANEQAYRFLRMLLIWFHQHRRVVSIAPRDGASASRLVLHGHRNGLGAVQVIRMRLLSLIAWMMIW